MVKDGDRGMVEPLPDNRAVFVPIRTPVDSDRVLIAPQAGGLPIATRLPQLRDGDPTVIYPAPTPNPIPVSVVNGCIPPRAQFGFRLVDSKLQVWITSKDVITFSDAMVREIGPSVFGMKQLGWKDFDPLDSTLEWPAAHVGYYDIQVEVENECSDDEYYDEWAEYCGAVIIPQVVPPTLLVDDTANGWNQYNPHITHAQIIWEESRGTEERVAFFDFSGRPDWRLRYRTGIVFGTESVGSGERSVYSDGSKAYALGLYPGYSGDPQPRLLRDVTGIGTIRAVRIDLARDVVPTVVRTGREIPYDYSFYRHALVAWIETVGGQSSIWTLSQPYYYTYPTPPPVQVITGLGPGADHLHINGDLACWQSNAGGSGNTVVVAQLSTGKILYTGPVQTGITGPKTCGAAVVWCAESAGLLRWTPSGGMTTLAIIAAMPDVDRGNIVYVSRWGDGLYRLNLYQSSTGQTMVLRRTENPIQGPSISNATVAWSELDPVSGLWQVWYLRSPTPVSCINPRAGLTINGFFEVGKTIWLGDWGSSGTISGGEYTVQKDSGPEIILGPWTGPSQYRVYSYEILATGTYTVRLRLWNECDQSTVVAAPHTVTK